MEQQLVVVRRQWDDGRTARVKLSDLHDIHWGTVSGGVSVRTPQPFLHGYVYCDEIIDGDIPHSCQHGPGPHRIKVCVVMKDNDPTVYAQLAEEAGSKPPRPQSCAKAAIELVREYGSARGPELRKELWERGHGRLTIDRVLPRLERAGRLVPTPGPRNSKVYHLPESLVSGRGII